MVNNAGKVVLLTGATGFLAKHLIPLLRVKGYYVIGVAKRDECDVFIDEYYRLDLMDRTLTSERVKQVSPDFVIHLAGISFVNHPTWEDLNAANVDATENLLCALQAHQPHKIQAVLLASSGIVYGENAVDCINEWVEPKPKNDYGKSKFAMESLAKSFAKDLPLVVTRFFNIIGPGQRDVFLVPKLIHHYAEKKDPIPLGNMDVSRDFSDVRDVCSAVESLMSRYSEKYRISEKDSTMSIYNVSNGHATPLREILSLLTELTQHAPKFIVRSDLLRDNEIMSLWGDNRKLTQDVEYQAQYSLQETLRWMLDSYTDN